MINSNCFSIRNFNIILLYVYVLFTFLFPVLFVNKAVFLVLLFNTILIFPLYKKEQVNVFINPFVISIIFIYGYILSLFSDCNVEASRQFATSPLNLFLVYLVLYYKIDISLIIRRVGLIVTICVLCIFLIYLFDKEVYSIVALFFQLYSGDAFGASERDFFSSSSGMGGILFFSLPGSYHLFLPLLLYYQAYLASRRKKTFTCFLLILFVVIMAGARAQLILSLGCLYLFYYYVVSRNKRQILVMALILVAFFSLYYLLNYTIFFSATEDSNSVKLGEAKSFWDSLGFVKLILGYGLASYYYVDVLGRSIYHTELSLFDMIRYVGLFQTLLYIVALIYPIGLNGWHITKLRAKPLIVIIALLAYSMTNPVLINSLGHIIIMWYWVKVLENEN